MVVVVVLLVFSDVFGCVVVLCVFVVDSFFLLFIRSFVLSVFVCLVCGCLCVSWCCHLFGYQCVPFVVCVCVLLLCP